MEVITSKVKGFLGLGGGGSRKRQFEEEVVSQTAEGEQGVAVRPSKRARREGPTSPEPSPGVSEEGSVGLGQRMLNWLLGGWRTGPLTSQEDPRTGHITTKEDLCKEDQRTGRATTKEDLCQPGRKKSQVGVGETIHAVVPSRLSTAGQYEVQLVKMVNKDPQEQQTDPSNITYDPLPSFSGFTSQSSRSREGGTLAPSASSSREGGTLAPSARSSPGGHIRTIHENTRHEMGNMPTNLSRGMKTSFRSTYDKFFSQKNVKSLFSKGTKKKTDFSHTSQMADKDLYRRVLDNYSSFSARSRSSIIKSPIGTRTNNYNFPTVRQTTQLHRPLFCKPDTAHTPGLISQLDTKPSPGPTIVTSTTIKTMSSSSRLVQETTSSPVLGRKEGVEELSASRRDTPGPVTNSLEQELLSRDVYSPSFLARLREKYDTGSLGRRKAIAREKIKKGYFEAKNDEVHADIDERLKEYLHITQVAVEEPEVEKEEEPTELPEITDEMMSSIRYAERSRGQVLVDAFKIQITCKDIETLKGLNWLNDEVINFYMQMIVARSGKGRFTPVYAFSTFFYPKLMDGGHSSVKRWTKKVDVFSHSLVLVPVHLGMHWCLATMDIKERTIKYYDSMGGNNTACLEALENYLKAEHLAKKSAPLDMSSWTREIVKNIPQQMNGSDCGMFACKFAEYLSRRARISFTQKNMPYFRKRMIWEIVNNSLLHP